MTERIEVGDTVVVTGSWQSFRVTGITPSGTVIGGTAKEPIIAKLDEVELVKGEDDEGEWR